MRSAGILTLGCKVNTYESEYVINKLKENNYEIIYPNGYNEEYEELDDITKQYKLFMITFFLMQLVMVKQ